MNLIERYLQAVSQALPVKQREDILKELRSSLYDALEGGEPTEERAAAIIKEMGSPQQVAAAYYPAGQYVIGPALYATFVTVLKIVLTVVIVVQVVATGLSFALVDNQGLLRGFGDLVTSLPVAVGYVVLIFWAIQRLEVQPSAEKPFDPRTLPPLEPVADPVSRVEQIFSIVINVAALSLLARFAQMGGFGGVEGWRFFENPVIAQYLPWLVATVVLSVALDIILIWRGRWEMSTRIGAILANLFGLGVLYVLFQGHNTWLSAEGVSGSVLTLSQSPDLLFTNSQLAGMIMFRTGIAFAILIVGVETAYYLYRLVRVWMDTSRPVAPGMLSVNR